MLYVCPSHASIVSKRRKLGSWTTAIFPVLSLAMSSETSDLRPTLLYTTWSPSSAFQWSRNRWPWNYLWMATVKFCSRQSAYVQLGRSRFSKTTACRLIRSATQMLNRESSFWRYKVYADIRGCCLEKMRQTTVESYVNTRAAHWRSLLGRPER